MRALIFLYGLVCYAVFFASFIYAIGFIGNVGVPRTIDAGGPVGPIGVALAIDVGLLALFGLQHSVMARPAFKRLWTRIVPPPAERSTYVLLSSAALILLFWEWRPMPSPVWDVHAPLGRNVLWGLFGGGWLLVLAATFLINHFELFGLQQVWRNLRRHGDPSIKFTEPFLYKVVRHPLYAGWLFVFWAAPSMTVGRLVFALVTTAYILVAIRFEERDLRTFHPEYADYSRRVPMLIPRLRNRQKR